jgi:hypothetical protein
LTATGWELSDRALFTFCIRSVGNGTANRTSQWLCR